MAKKQKETITKESAPPSTPDDATLEMEPSSDPEPAKSSASLSITISAADLRNRGYFAVRDTLKQVKHFLFKKIRESDGTDAVISIQ